jgi:uncharacterized protein
MIDISGDISIKHKMICDIPLLEVSRTEVFSDKPLVIMYHGYRSRKESMLQQAYYIAQHGMFAVIPDAYMHGERNKDDIEADISEVVIKTARETDILIDAYRCEKTGLAGYSMGGFIVYSYIARNTGKIKAAVSVISTPDWVSVMKTEYAAVYFSRIGILPDSLRMKDLLKETEEIQPLTYYRNMVDIPLLMLNGGVDPVISLDGPQKIYGLLEPLYKNKEDIVLKVYKDIGHSHTYEMDMEAALWLEKHLRS